MSKKPVFPVPSGSGSIRGPIEPDGHITVVEINSDFGRIARLKHDAEEALERVEMRIETIHRELKATFPRVADSRVDDAVPELGQKLLPFLLPRKLRDAVAGDLAQDFQDYVAKFGRTYAVRWFWWELGWLCVSRLSPTAVVAAIAFWLRRKIGF